MNRTVSKAKRILGVDIDNVLAESDACLRTMIRQRFQIALDEKDITQYDYGAYGVTEEQLVEVFNLFNHANFGLPSVNTITASGAILPTAGKITNTVTSSRQLQFGLKLTF